MDYRKYYEKLRNRDQAQVEKYTNYVSDHHSKAHVIYQEDKSQNKFARAQYKRNLDQLRMQYMDNLYSRRQGLIDMYTREQDGLMSEFEAMKKNEVHQLYDRQSEIIDQYKKEQAANFKALRDRADNIRVATSNEVRSEKMNLETAKTATYNKFTKEVTEAMKRDENDKEKRYYEMKYFDDYERRCYDEHEKILGKKEVLNDYKHQLGNQIQDSKAQKQFKHTINRDTYLQLTALEEKQVELEKKLQEEKKLVMRNHLVKTIDDNKVKIAQKKLELAQVREDEKQEQVRKRQALEAEMRQAQEEKQKKKYEMKRMMSKQLQEGAKKKEDQYELDRLAQVEADKKNAAFDTQQIRKDTLRKELVKQAVFGNQEILQHKDWNKGMGTRSVRQDLTVVNKDYENWEKENSDDMLQKKYDKKNNMGDLTRMMKEQQDENLNATGSNLKLEQMLLKDAEKFDGYVSDIVKAKREYLDKLRSQRPF